MTHSDSSVTLACHRILNVSPVPYHRLERLITKSLTSRNSSEFLDSLASDTFLIRRVSPELAGIVKFGGGSHKELWSHTKQVVAQTPPVAHLRWAALFHDVGKPDCFRRSGSQIMFYGHEAESSRQFDQFCFRNRFFSADFRSRVRFLIRNLGWVEGYSSDWTESAVRRFAKNMGEYAEDLVTLSQADVTTKHDWKRNRIVRSLEELKARILKVRAEDAVQPLLPKGLGTAVSESFNIPPSRRIGEILSAVENSIKCGQLEPRLGVKTYLTFISSHLDQFGLEIP